jgi:LuxR family transcriptional regulator, maltose regulon positive regulatory protein
VLARVLLAQDRPGQALALLERLHELAAAQGRLDSVIEIRALQALALAASGDEAGVVAVLAEALMLACPQGYVRVFADEGAPMGALLGRLVAAQRTAQPQPAASRWIASAGCCAPSSRTRRAPSRTQGRAQQPSRTWSAWSRR